MGDDGPKREPADRLSRPPPKPAIVARLTDPGVGPRRRLNACVHLIKSGEIGAAVSHLMELLEVPELRDEVNGLLAACRDLRPLKSEVRATIADGTTADGATTDGYRIVATGSATTVVAFAGMADRIGISIYFTQRLLRNEPVNIIVLFDWTNAYYLGGVDGLGGTLPETVARLRQLCTGLGTRRLICLGQSAGGYGALRYGPELDADGVIAFSPVILTVLEGEPYRRVCSAIGPVDPANLDLRSYYAGRAHTPFTRIVYGADAVADVRSAMHMAGLPRVDGHPLPGISEHAVLTELALSRQFAPLFRRFRDDVGPGRWAAGPTLP